MKAPRREIQELSYSELMTTRRFEVPIYQRTYAWEELNWDTLWDDITRTAKDNKVSTSNVTYTHMLASILVKKVNDSWELVDGQQRVLTLTLLLHAIRPYDEELSRQTRDQLYNALYQISGVRGDSTHTPRLYLAYLSEDHYDLIVDYDRPRAFYARGESQVSKAYRHFAQKVVDLYQKGEVSVEEFTSTALNNLTLIFIPTTAEENPQKIYESMNGLAKELSASELVKNYVLMSIGDPATARSTYSKYWKTLDSDAWTKDEKAKKDLSDLIHDYLIAKGAEPKLKDDTASIYQTFKSYAALGDSSPRATDKSVQISRELAHLASERRRWESHEIKDRLHLMYLRVATRNSMNPKPILYFYSLFFEEIAQHYGQPLTEDIQEFMIEPVESWFFRNAMTRKGPRFSKTIIRQLLKVKAMTPLVELSLEDYAVNFTINLVSEIHQVDTHSFPTNNEVYHKVLGANSLPPETLRMALIAYEYHQRSKDRFTGGKIPYVDRDTLTLEHWMPKNPKAGDWTLMNEDNRPVVLESLGNLTLLPASINRLLSNESLPEKYEKVQRLLDEQNLTTTNLHSFDLLLSILQQGADGTQFIWEETQMKEYGSAILLTLLEEVFRPLSEVEIEHVRAQRGITVVTGIRRPATNKVQPTSFTNVELTDAPNLGEKLQSFRQEIFSNGTRNTAGHYDWHDPQLDFTSASSWLSAAFGTQANGNAWKTYNPQEG